MVDVDDVPPGRAFVSPVAGKQKSAKIQELSIRLRQQRARHSLPGG